MAEVGFNVGNITTTVPRRYREEEMIALFRRRMRDAHNKSTRDAKSILRTAIRTSGAVATKTLINSVTSKMVEGRSTKAMLFDTDVGFKEPADKYAYFANYGREAGGPLGTSRSEGVSGTGSSKAINNIMEWMKAKGIPESALWAIVYTISEYGVEGRGFIELALPIIERNTQKIIGDAAADFSRELSNV